jgi:hypothetical protein
MTKWFTDIGQWNGPALLLGHLDTAMAMTDEQLDREFLTQQSQVVLDRAALDAMGDSTERLQRLTTSTYRLFAVIREQQRRIDTVRIPDAATDLADEIEGYLESLEP